MKIGVHILALLVALSCPAISLADPVKMSIQPNGKGSFFLTGENVAGVKELDVEIEYDTSLLDNPSVSINGGDLTEVNAATPGKLFISIFRPVADPFLDVTMDFDTKTDRAGGVNHVSANSRSLTKWPSDDDEDFPLSSDGAHTGHTGASATGSSTQRADGTALEVLVPMVRTGVAPFRNKGTDRIYATTGEVTSAEACNKILNEETAILVHEEKNVLQRFKQFSGKKGLRTFAALFGRCDGDRFVQEPPIAISDGKTPVTITIQVQPAGLRTAGMALADATLISNEANVKGIVLTLLPSEGTWDARIVIVEGQDILGYPIVVAPPVNLTDAIDENNFIDALQAYINNQPPTYQRDDKIYIPEYVFTANYLAGMLKKASLASSQH